MTTIIALEHNNKIYLASDKQVTYDTVKNITIYPKIRKFGYLTIGAAGNLSKIQKFFFEISKIKFPRPPSGDQHEKCVDYLFDNIINNIPDIFDLDSFDDKDDDDRLNIDLVITWPGFMCEMTGLKCVTIPKDFTIVGSGTDIARGALLALADIDMPIKDKLTKVYSIINSCDLNTSAEFTFIEIT